MNTSITRDTVVILGIPIDNLDISEAIERIFALVECYKEDHKSKYVATINVDFIVNTLGWTLSGIRHPELLDILRRVDLVTADGMPIVWVSKLLGEPLKERVAGSDMVPILMKEAAIRKKSIFFLGGKGDIAQKAADRMKQKHPDLQIAGIYSPFVHIDGEDMLDSELDDASIIDKVNKSGADILLIGFGNPKQEVWFERNRTRLKVPISIGIGGTYEFIVGSVARAPLWMQKAGLEWIHRITQDPKRLWKRYFIGFFKFGFLILPSVIYHKYKRLIYKHVNENKRSDEIPKTVEIQTHQSIIQVITIPDPLDAQMVSIIKNDIESKVLQTAHPVLDLRDVNFIDSSGLGLLVSLWRKTIKDGRQILMTGVNESSMKLFELSRTGDLFEDKIFDSVKDAHDYIKKKSDLPSYYYLEREKKEYIQFDLIGKLDAGQMVNLDVDAFFSKIGERNCILNLTYLSFVDSSGIMFFLKVQKYIMSQGRHCVLYGLQKNVIQMFRITKLDRLFKITEDLPIAEIMLTEKQG